MPAPAAAAAARCEANAEAANESPNLSLSGIWRNRAGAAAAAAALGCDWARAKVCQKLPWRLGRPLIQFDPPSSSSHSSPRGAARAPASGAAGLREFATPTQRLRRVSIIQLVSLATAADSAKLPNHLSPLSVCPSVCACVCAPQSEELK